MTKIDIISGFLGAGKTTFIKKMIDEAFKGEQIVLIENEFGEVGIDGGFLKDAGIQITEMNSGCICCSLVGDFGKNLNEVITKYHPDRILIEPSGVGKLSDVMKSVIDIEKEQPVKLNALVTVVNALKASKQMKAFGEFFNNQGCHDHDHEHGHHHADDVFTSWGKETPHKFERAKLEEILKQFVEDDKILRSKGMVEGTDGKWIYFDMVPGEYEIRDGEPDYTGRIVVIGTDIHEHELEELFGLA